MRQPELLGVAALGWWLWSQTLVDLLAGWADRELLRVATGNPLLAAERGHWVTQHRRLNDLVLLHIVRVALVIARLNYLLLLALQKGGVGGLATDAAGTEVIVLEIAHALIIQVYGVTQSHNNLDGLATAKHG